MKAEDLIKNNSKVLVMDVEQNKLLFGETQNFKEEAVAIFKHYKNLDPVVANITELYEADKISDIEFLTTLLSTFMKRNLK